MKVSCIIPTYNRREMVSDSIKSAKDQYGYEVEIVVIDDGSSDGTADFINDNFDNVIFVRQDNSGPGLARNTGVAASQGDVIMFLDSDDAWLPHHVKSIMDILASGYEVAYGTTLTKDRINNNEFLIPDDGKGADGDCITPLSQWCFMVPSSVGLSRKAFERVGGFSSDSFGEDWAFFMQLAEWFPFGFAGPDPITIRQLHEGSLCCLQGKETIINAIHTVSKIVSQSKKNNRQHLLRFEQLEKWVVENGKGLKTVQDWYYAMKIEGMV